MAAATRRMARQLSRIFRSKSIWKERMMLAGSVTSITRSVSSFCPSGRITPRQVKNAPTIIRENSIPCISKRLSKLIMMFRPFGLS